MILAKASVGSFDACIVTPFRRSPRVQIYRSGIPVSSGHMMNGRFWQLDPFVISIEEYDALQTAISNEWRRTRMQHVNNYFKVVGQDVRRQIAILPFNDRDERALRELWVRAEKLRAEYDRTTTRRVDGTVTPARVSVWQEPPIEGPWSFAPRVGALFDPAFC